MSPERLESLDGLRRRYFSLLVVSAKRSALTHLCLVPNLAEMKQVGLNLVRFISASIEHPRICLEQRRLHLDEHLEFYIDLELHW